ncbi:MAG TPA: NAD(P)-dependent oxidoreductase, partial [Stellaceae bacterium]|nr:NAD(P)-dependent oxidoreductase [Stellaceae bacterium]
MPAINILSIQRSTEAERARIAALDKRVRLVDAGGWFDGEIRDTWTDFAVARYLTPDTTGSGTREERDRLLAAAEIVIGGWPFPRDLRSRAPLLRWFHQRQAGASNLFTSDLWGSEIVVTTSRGVANPLPIAEYAIAGILHFAMGLHHAAFDRQAGAFDHRLYRPLLVQGKTLCVVGAGGIGREVGRLGAALGMRVVGTRRHAATGEELPPGFNEIGGADDLDRLLPQADFVAICCQWTRETTGLFNRARFAAMKKG